MKKFSYADIESWGPCYSPERYLDTSWQGTILDILDDKRIPFQDRLWVILRTEFVSEKLMQLFAVWCATQVHHLMTDKRSLDAIDVAERFANGQATFGELTAARAAAWDAARGAAQAAAWDVAWDVAWDAARDAAQAAARDAAQAAARGAAWDVAWDAARAAAWDAARDAAQAAAWDVAWDAARDAARAVAWDAARAAAWDAARAAQESKLREMILAGLKTGDTTKERQGE